MVVEPKYSVLNDQCIVTMARQAIQVTGLHKQYLYNQFLQHGMT